MIVVNFQGEEKKFHPEEISSMVLTKMKETERAVDKFSSFFYFGKG